jgi:hypothetical protein
MEKIPDILKNIIKYEMFDENEEVCYTRIENIPLIKKNKDQELKFIIEVFTKEKFIPTNWINYAFKVYPEEQTCICSQNNCINLFFRKHINTGFIFKIGSECILKFYDDEKEKEEEKKKLNNIIKEFKKEKCKVPECNNKIENKRTNLGKEGYCSKYCKENIENPFCYCDMRAVKKRCKNGKNIGKYFLTCKNSYYDKNIDKWFSECTYFKWK